jgi:hypothetical protein
LFVAFGGAAPSGHDEAWAVRGFLIERVTPKNLRPNGKIDSQFGSFLLRQNDFKELQETELPKAFPVVALNSKLYVLRVS